MILEGVDSCPVVRICKMTSAPEGKWFCHPQTMREPQKWPVLRVLFDSGHRNGCAERQQNVSVSSADPSSWVSHRKHGSWKAKKSSPEDLRTDNLSVNDKCLHTMSNEGLQDAL